MLSTIQVLFFYVSRASARLELVAIMHMECILNGDPIFDCMGWCLLCVSCLPIAWHGTDRFSWDPRKVKDVTYNARVAVSPEAPVQQAPIRITVLGSWWAALLLVCTTMMVLASSFTAFILYVRPLLKVICPSSLVPHLEIPN